MGGFVTLFAVLFFGGMQEYFYIEQLEKGVKQYVLDEDRSKDILTDLKKSNDIIKAFNKNRKRKQSEFLSMNLDPDIEREDFDDFFDQREEERIALQEVMLESRLNVVSKIHDDEWQNTIAISDAVVEKENKNSDPFESVMQTINRTIKDNNSQAQAIVLTQNFQIRFTQFEDEVNSFKSEESTFLNNKNTTAREFQSLDKNMNLLRKTAYKAFVDFHFDMKEITSEIEWLKVMKSINKLIA